jgi:hypothetical protein
MILLAGCGLALLLTLSACARKPASAARQPTAHERQDRAMKDPFGYKPDWTGTGVSGGGTGQLDKEGLRRDIDHVFIH